MTMPSSVAPASDPSSTPDAPKKRRRRRWPIITLAIVGVLVLVGAGGYFGGKWVAAEAEAGKVRDFQSSLAAFYTSPSTPAAPGELIRIEPIANLDIPGGTAYRMLYGTQAPDGSAAVSSGMILIPDSPAPAAGRPVLAWAHGTLGFGDDCTPSRTFEPTLNGLDFGSWATSAMQRGWVVTATDYTGAGTAGDPYYLISQSEAHDVINSVRAARNYADAHASNVYATFGHSQGGHASLATGLYTTYAPELDLVAVSAAAPAAQLGALFSQQYAKPVAWGDGPSVAVSWPLVYPGLPLDGVLTASAMKDYSELAHGCLLQEVDQLLVKKTTGAQFFDGNPLENTQWAAAAKAETIDPTALTVPVFLVQSLSDNVVLPNTNALLSQEACAAEKSFTISWLDMVTHEDTAVMGGMLAMNWLQDRFDGIPATSSCAQPLPLTPATSPF